MAKEVLTWRVCCLINFNRSIKLIKALTVEEAEAIFVDWVHKHHATKDVYYYIDKSSNSSISDEIAQLHLDLLEKQAEQEQQPARATAIAIGKIKGF